MDRVDSPSRAVAIALGCIVCAGVVAWFAWPRHDAAASVERGVAGEGASAQVTPEQHQALLDELAAARAERDRWKEQAESATARSAVAPIAPAPVAAAPAVVEEAAKVSAAFTDERYAAMLAAIDWKVMGEASKELEGLLASLATTMLEGGEMSLADVAAIQKTNAKLIEQLVTMQEHDLPGFGPNGVFTHPLVAGNQIQSALAEFGMPMTGPQLEMAKATLARFVTEADTLSQTQESMPSRLDQMIAEVEMKERFFAEMRQVMTPEQVAALYPESVRGRVGLDIFNAGLMMQGACQPVDARSPDAFARGVTDHIARSMPLEGARGDEIRALVARWTRSFPASMWDPAHSDSVETGPLSAMRTERAMQAARLQAQLAQQLLARSDLTQAERDAILRNAAILVPLPR